MQGPEKEPASGGSTRLSSRTLQKTHFNGQFIFYEANLSILSESIRRRHDALNPKK